jgi:transcriptional regulator with XRE-family HTH domain
MRIDSGKQPISIDRRVCRELFGRPDSAGLTKLARRAGLNQSHLWRILNRERIPGVIVFKQLAEALKMSMDRLFIILYPELETRRKER